VSKVCAYPLGGGWVFIANVEAKTTWTWVLEALHTWHAWAPTSDTVFGSATVFEILFSHVWFTSWGHDDRCYPHCIHTYIHCRQGYTPTRHFFVSPHLLGVLIIPRVGGTTLLTVVF